VAPVASPVGGGADFRSVSVRGLSGQAAALSDVLERRPTLVSFWAPWCEPCLREQPDLERLSHAAQACGGAVVGVAVGETPDGIAAFVQRKGLTFPQFTDENFTLADAIGQRRIPTTMVFDGAQRLVFTGEALDARSTAALKGLLVARPGAPACAMP
jgi:peroxiredoxin